MKITKEEADNNLRKAIIEHAVAYEMYDEPEIMLNHYFIVAHWVENDGASLYTHHLHTEDAPTHYRFRVIDYCY